MYRIISKVETKIEDHRTTMVVHYDDSSFCELSRTDEGYSLNLNPANISDLAPVKEATPRNITVKENTVNEKMWKYNIKYIAKNRNGVWEGFETEPIRTRYSWCHQEANISESTDDVYIHIDSNEVFDIMGDKKTLLLQRIDWENSLFKLR